MSTHPIIANGETYAMPFENRKGGGPKKRPYSFLRQRQKINDDIDKVLRSIHTDSKFTFRDFVVCIRMNFGFIAKSYQPNCLEDSYSHFIGGCPSRSYDKPSKLYFLLTTEPGIRELKRRLFSNSSSSEFKNCIETIDSLDFLTDDEKRNGFSNTWEHGIVEVVFHPLGAEYISLIRDILKENVANGLASYRTYVNGPIFALLDINKNVISQLIKYNSLRTIHPIGNIRIENDDLEKKLVPTPVIMQDQYSKSVKIGVFDGGANKDNIFLKGNVVTHSKTPMAPSLKADEHATNVCGILLYGKIDKSITTGEFFKSNFDIDSYRVLPSDNRHRSSVDAIGLYDAIDAIEAIVKPSQTLLYNLSFGPVGPIINDVISRFTYSLDKLTYDISVDGVHPCFCIAVGNDGKQDEDDMRRIQSPSDMINGIAVGSYYIDEKDTICRASYSCIGPGREGAKIKPDLLEYSGDYDFWIPLISYNDLKINFSAGTSFAAPLVVRKIAQILQKSSIVDPHMCRALMIHHAKECPNENQMTSGYGLAPVNADAVLQCDDNRVTILYSGTLISKQCIKIPIFLPDIQRLKGTVKITWTICTVVDPYMLDSDAYTSNCIEDTFYPNSNLFKFTKELSSKSVNIITNKTKATDLINAGYLQSKVPASHSVKYQDEADLRSQQLKWDTVVKKGIVLNAKSIFDPFIVIKGTGRNGNEEKAIDYSVVITIDAPKYDGVLYDQILQRFPNLIPIDIQVANFVKIKIKS